MGAKTVPSFIWIAWIFVAALGVKNIISICPVMHTTWFNANKINFIQTTSHEQNLLSQTINHWSRKKKLSPRKGLENISVIWQCLSITIFIFHTSPIPIINFFQRVSEGSVNKSRMNFMRHYNKLQILIWEVWFLP